MKRLALLAMVCWSVGGHAQEMSNLPSTTMSPSAPAGAAPGAPASPYYPGMPQPQAPATTSPTTGGPGTKPGEKSGLILTDDFSGSDVGEVSVAPGGPPTEVPETYVVVKGDTLWDLSSRYYRNAWAWPKLWSYNPAITNPHWIYPGDVIRLVPPGGGPAPAPAPATAATEPRKIQGGMRPGGVYLRQTGFVEPGELAQAGRIVGSKEEKIMLATLDEAYVEYTRDKPFQVGERYTVYHPTHVVKHPLTGKTLGHMVEILGEGEVRAVTDGRIARVAIVDSTNPIERGWLIGPLKRQFKLVDPRTDRTDQQGVIVATLQPRNLIGAENIVFVDRGKDDGVELGNRFIVVRRGDGYQPVLAKGPVDDRRFPRETIAEILVVDLRDHLSTGFVMKSTKEARVGDRVEARKGY